MTNYRALFADIPRFRSLWVSRIVAGIAASLQWVALLWLGSHSANPATMTSFIVFALTTPAVILGPLVGSIVDQIDRRQLLVYAGIAQAVLAFLVPVAFTAVGLIAAVGVAFVQTFFAVVFTAAYGASLPEIVHSERLPMANGINQTGLHIGNVVGATAGGFLLQNTAFATPYIIVGIALLLSAAAAAQLPSLLPAPSSGPRQRYGIHIVQGWQYWKSDRRLVLLTVIGVIAVIGFAPAPVALVILVTDGLGADSSVYGMFQSFVTIGLALGAIVTGRWTVGRHRGTMMAFGYIAMGVATAGLAIAPTVVYAAAVVLLRSAGNSVVSVPGASLLQTAAPSEVRGRVLTLVSALQELPRALIVPLSGVIIDRIGVHATYFTMAVFIAVAGIVAFLARFFIDPPDFPSQSIRAAVQPLHR